MSKQTLIFENPVQLSLKQSQLCITYKDSPEQEHFRAIEDIAMILVDNHSVFITIPLLGVLAENNVAVVFCDQKHMSASMLMNLDANCKQQKFFRLQIEASVPTKKQMWKNVVELKIRNQAQLLESLGKNATKLFKYTNCVRSGDSTNCEGHAAQIYWKELMGKGFVRDRFGECPNTFLNYGYTILRAATAKALMSSGLLPALGIFHRNYYDAFPLADDIMEPYSPFIDQVVIKLMKQKQRSLTKEVKHSFLELFYQDVPFGEQMVQLGTCLNYTASSVAKFFAAETKTLSYPRIICG